MYEIPVASPASAVNKPRPIQISNQFTDFRHMLGGGSRMALPQVYGSHPQQIWLLRSEYTALISKAKHLTTRLIPSVSPF